MMKYLIPLMLMIILSPVTSTGQGTPSELRKSLQEIQAIYNDVPGTCPQTRNWLNKMMQMYRCLQANGDCTALLQDVNTLAIGELQREIEARPECLGVSEKINGGAESKNHSESTKVERINSQEDYQNNGRYLDDSVEKDSRFKGKYVEVGDEAIDVCARARFSIVECRKRALFLQQQVIDQRIVFPIYKIDDVLKQLKDIEITISADCSESNLGSASKHISAADVSLRQIESEYEKKKRQNDFVDDEVKSEPDGAEENLEKNYADRLRDWAGNNYDEYAWMLIRYLGERTHKDLKPIVKQLLGMKAPIEALENIRIIVCGGSNLGNIKQEDMDKITDNISNATHQVELRKELRKKYCPEG